MRRRDFIGLIGGGAVAWPLDAYAQQPERVRLVAILMGLAEDDPETKARFVKLRNEIEKLGWTEGRNVRIEVRFAPAGENAQALAKELIALQPDVILAHSAQVAGVVHRETRTIPVVFVNVSDPIGAGFIDCRPNSPACCTTRWASSANGWRCSRRWRRVSRALP